MVKESLIAWCVVQRSQYHLTADGSVDIIAADPKRIIETCDFPRKVNCHRRSNRSVNSSEQRDCEARRNDKPVHVMPLECFGSSKSCPHLNGTESRRGQPMG